MPSAEDADYRLDFIARPSHHGSIDVGEKRIPVNRTATTHILITTSGAIRLFLLR
jgi:hypothetical protein